MTTANGWQLREDRCFADEYARLVAKVRALEKHGPENYRSHPVTKLLLSIQEYIYRRIPDDPGATEFRQGNTLGGENRHWFRAKFHGRYRLFYRYSTAHKTIIYVWLNNELSLRKAGSKSDPYAKFAAMLASGDPPSDFDELLRRSRPLA